VSGLIGLLGLAALLCAYFLPAIIAAKRKVPHEGSIVVVNIFLGWTLVGWVVALAMACRSVPPRQALAPWSPPRWPDRPALGPLPPPCYRCGTPADLHPGGRCPAPEISRSPHGSPS
jgi:hypothetical protein